MFKILLICVFAIYLIYRISGFITKILGYGLGRNTNSSSRSNGNVHVENPNESKSNYKGGEYVDFEEVK